MAERGIASRFEIGSSEAAADAASGRRLVTYTPDQAKIINRAAKVLADNGDKFAMRCGQAGCPSPGIQFERNPDAAGGAILVCGCTRRRLPRTLK